MSEESKRDSQLSVKFTAQQLALLDEARRQHPKMPSRPELVRELVMLQLATMKPGKRAKADA